jgi:SAM-dependent methyltransferase
MEDVTCIFCKKTNYDIAIEDNSYTGRRCDLCNLIYISPRPSLAEIVDYYGHNESAISADRHIASGHIKRLHARHNLQRLTQYVSSGSLLELGAGAGYFLLEAREIGFEVHGIELNTLLAVFMRKHLKIPCEESPFDVTSFGGKKFDVIYHCDVLSHFYDPIADFTRMHERLTDGGILAFQTGNFADVQKKFYGFIDSFLYPEHLFFFGEQSLVELFGRTGFELLATYKTSLMPYYLWRKLGDTYRFLRRNVVSKWRLVRGLKKWRDQLRSLRFDGESKKGSGTAQAETRSPEKQEVYSVPSERWNLRLRNSCTHFMQYKLGRFVPRRGRPQSILVIARKT